MNIILVFPKIETAKSIKVLLQRNGYSVDAVCTTVAQGLHVAGELDGGIIVSNYRLVDGMALEFYEDLHPNFQLLMIAPKDYIDSGSVRDVFSLTTPLHGKDLLDTLETISYAYTRWRKKKKAARPQRTQQEQKTIDLAKMLLMDRNGLSESDAHRYIQKSSMDNGTGVVEMAFMILALMNE